MIPQFIFKNEANDWIITNSKEQLNKFQRISKKSTEIFTSNLEKKTEKKKTIINTLSKAIDAHNQYNDALMGLSLKKYLEDVDDASKYKQAKDFDNKREYLDKKIKELLYLLDTDMNEMTTTASSGAFEAPMGLNKREMNTQYEITQEDVHKIVNRVLREQALQNKKFNYNFINENEFKKIVNKKFREQVQAENKKNNEKYYKDAENNVSNQMENNVSDDNPYKDTTKPAMQTPEQEILAHQVSPLDYDIENDTEGKTFQKWIDSNVENIKKNTGNGSDVEHSAELVKQLGVNAKKRKEIRNNRPFNKIDRLGGNAMLRMEENLKPQKKATYKYVFENADAAANKTPDQFKKDGFVYIMEDQVRQYIFQWNKNGLTESVNLLEVKETLLEQQQRDLFLRTLNYKTYTSSRPKTFKDIPNKK